MKRIGMIMVLSTLLMVGCTKKPSEIKMPNTKEELQEVADYINKNLEGDDKALASEAVAKSAMAVAIGMPVNKEMTLADAMERIKAEKEKEKALQQKNVTVIAEMNKSL